MLPLVNSEFVTLTPYVPGKPVSETERELGLSGVLKLASNENPLGPSPRAMEAVSRAIAGLNDYPDGSAFYLKGALAEFHGVGANQLVVGNGTNEIIEMLGCGIAGRYHNFVHTFGRDDLLEPIYISRQSW